MTAACVVTAWGCGSARPAVTAPVAHAIAVAGVPREPPWRGYVVPARDMLELVSREADGTLDILYSGERAVAHTDGSLVFAPGIATAGLSGATDDGTSGFWFGTRDGLLLHADAFAGELTTVGEAHDEIAAWYASRGNSVARGARNELLVGTRDGFATPVALRGVSWVDAGFVDANFGVVVRTPGELLRTLDGGASFETVGTGGAVVYGVQPDGHGFDLLTTAGRMRVERTGDALSAPDAVMTGPEGLSNEDEDELALRADVSDPLADVRWLRWQHHGAVLADGRAARIVARTATRGERLVFEVRVPGRARTRVPAPPGDCSAPQAWGERFVAACGDEAEETLYAFDEAHEPEALGTFASGRANLRGPRWFTASPDGTTVLVWARCPHEASRGATSASACLYDRGVWREVEAAANHPTGTLAGTHLVVEHDDSAVSTVIDLDAPVSSDPPADTPDGRTFTSVSRTAGGEILARLAGGGIAIGRWDAGAAMRTSVPPALLGAIDFADALHGMLAEPTGALYVTDDGGTHWSPLVVRGARQWRDEVHCNARACTAGDVVWTAPIPHAPVTVTARDPHPLIAGIAPEAMAFGTRGPVWQCGVETSAGTSPRTGRTPGTRASSQATVLFGDDGWVSIERGATGAVTWDGRDSVGTFAGRSRRGALPAMRAVEHVRASAVTRGFVLLEQCSDALNDEVPECRLVTVVRDGGSSVLLESATRLQAEGLARAALVQDTLPLRDGGLAVLLSTRIAIDVGVASRREFDPPLDLLVEIDARGRLVRTRPFAWPAFARPLRLLAVTPDGPALLALGPDAHAATLYDLDPAHTPRGIAAPHADMVPLCANTTPGSTAAITVAGSANGLGPGVFVANHFLVPSENGPSRLALDATSGAWCVSGVRFRSFGAHDLTGNVVLLDLGGAPWLTVREGMLDGVVVGPSGERPLHCTALLRAVP